MPSIVTDSPFDQLRKHFKTGQTRPLASRRKSLEQLRAGIEKHEAEILTALKTDLGKHPFEAFTTEVALVREEISYALENLADWMLVKQVSTPIAVFSASSSIHPQPKGLVLIFSPWNYPFNLTMAPLVAALTAGNVVVVKPSEQAPATSKIIAKMLREFLPTEVVQCVEGDATVATELLNHSWDHVFFTGSTSVGKIVAKICAEHLTPCTLELGGKSPCIVDATADIKQAAKRIVWGKFVNAGQTCVAPDYLLVHETIKDSLIESMKKYIRQFYGDNPDESTDYGRIVNHAHYDRVSALITSGTAVYGGRRQRETLYIEPTIIDGVTLDHPAMTEEIFGPILPVMTWKDKAELMSILETAPNPLALYLFTKNKEFEQKFVESVAFGGGCINHTLLHLGNPLMPFGGIRQSGLGSYHGKFGFDTFSHFKSILKAGPIDFSIKYPKYRAWKLRVVRWWFS